MASLNENFQKNVVRLRKKANLTQEALATKAGVCTSYVSMLERGERNPPLDTVESIAKALGAKPYQLLAA